MLNNNLIKEFFFPRNKLKFIPTYWIKHIPLNVSNSGFT